MSAADNLTPEQARSVLNFLLYRMPIVTRRALMAELPVAYARLYPSVDPAVILERVSATMDGTQ